MPTNYRRIAVTEDPELAEALRNASGELPGLSGAALVRELALRGARTLPVKAADQRVGRIIAQTGARPARGNLQEYLRNNRPVKLDLDDPNALSRALDEQREDKI